MRPRLDCDCQDEEGRGDIAKVDEEALDGAWAGVADDILNAIPVPAEEEPECLDEVGQEQVAE
jgi:hypothetical protein